MLVGVVVGFLFFLNCFDFIFEANEYEEKKVLGFEAKN